MDEQTTDILLWDVENEDVVTALRDFIEDWKVSHNSDLKEYLRSYPGYFKNNDATREAIRLVLGYAKELMDGQRSSVDFYENKIWKLEDGRQVRFAHYYEREIAKLMRTITAAKEK